MLGVLVGDLGSTETEKVISGLVVLASIGGVMGLSVVVVVVIVKLVAALLFVAVLLLLGDVITVRGRRFCLGSPLTRGAGFTTVTGAAAEGWTTAVAAVGITGLNPEGKTPLGMLPLVGAREMMGVEGTGKATLNRGRLSAVTPVGKLAGGERLSGEARGGVRGAYMDTAGMTDTGVC